MSNADARPFEFTSDLTILIDCTHPLAYLALPATRTLADELGAQGRSVTWLPLIVPSSVHDPERIEGDDRGARHRRSRAVYQARETAHYASALGLPLDALFATPDPRPSARAMLWVSTHHANRLSDYVDAAFAARFAGRFDIGDRAAIARVLTNMDAGGEQYLARSDALDVELTELQSSLRNAGLFNVPGYVVGNSWADDEVFFGRQHMPMLRWLFAGRVGQPPV